MQISRGCTLGVLGTAGSSTHYQAFAQGDGTSYEIYWSTTPKDSHANHYKLECLEVQVFVHVTVPITLVCHSSMPIAPYLRSPHHLRGHQLLSSNYLYLHNNSYPHPSTILLRTTTSMASLARKLATGKHQTFNSSDWIKKMAEQKTEVRFRQQ